MLGAASMHRPRTVTPFWSTLKSRIQEWRVTVERLAREFASGSAAVAPKRVSTCEHCPFPALCRIGDLPAQVEEVEDE